MLVGGLITEKRLHAGHDGTTAAADAADGSYWLVCDVVSQKNNSAVLLCCVD